MLRVTVLGYRPVQDEVVVALQRAGVLQIETTPFELDTEHIPSDDPRMRALDQETADARFVHEFLGRYHENTQPFSAFITEKFHLSHEEYLGLRFAGFGEQLYEECLRISDRLAAGERERERLQALVADLRPWAELEYPISQWRCTQTTDLVTGTVPASEAEEIRQKLREIVPEVTVDEYGTVDGRQAWVVIAHHCCSKQARAALASTDFSEVSFPGLSGIPADEIARAEQRISELEAEAAELDARARELAEKHYASAVALVEAVESQRDRLRIKGSVGHTERVFAMSGWVAADRSQALDEALASFSADVDITLVEPTKDDIVPVELRNPKWLEPFEVLTDLYGRPQYGEIDPTPLLAPFFALFFGICIGDFGYGLMLIVAAWLIKTRLDVAPGVKRFMGLLMYGGASAMVIGVLFASYFALPVENLPPFLARLQVLDPLGELTTFLVITAGLGVIQVFFGVVVAAVDAFRRGDVTGAVFGQLSTIWFFGMLAAFAVTRQGVLLSLALIGTMLMQGGALQAAFGEKDRSLLDRAIGWAWLALTLVAAVGMGVGPVGMWLAVFGVASVIAAVVSSTGRAGVIGLLGGAYSVYGMSAFIGDTLSYTRLAALALSGALVGMVFNLLAGLVWTPAMNLFSAGGISIVWGALVALIAAAIFVVGHVFNVVINLLGAFVHPARLQFIEFFSKFFAGGGSPFAPFKMRSNNLVLEAGGTGPEGGAG